MDALQELLDRYSITTLDVDALAALAEHHQANLADDLRAAFATMPQNAADWGNAELVLGHRIDEALRFLDGARSAPPPLAASAGTELSAASPVIRRVEARSNPTKPVAPARPSAPGSVLRASNGRAVPHAELPTLIEQGLRDVARGYAPSGALYSDGFTRLASVEAVPSAAQLGGDGYANAAVIESAVERHTQALRASGGICGPAPLKYDLPTLPQSNRPVRDSLVPLDAPRGGFRILQSPTLADVEDGVTLWSEANDVALNDPSVKGIVEMDCPQEIERLCDAVVMRMRLGNYAARYNSELVARWLRTLQAAHARLAETNLLAYIDGDATSTSAGQLLGTARDVLAALDRASAHLRYRSRLLPADQLVAIMPSWLREEMKTDLTREQPGSSAERLAVSDAQCDAFFTSRNISPVWSVDACALPASQAAATGLNAWPSHCLVRLFAAGTVAFVDGGSLDLGLVRDSTLNATNDVELFYESFETVLTLAGTPLSIDIDICPSGETAAPISTTGICSLGS